MNAGAGFRSLKALTLRLPVVTGLAAARRRRINGTAIFCCHNVTADDSTAAMGERSLHVPAREFDDYVRWIASAYSVVPLDEVIARLASNRTLHGTACITFDDAYQGVLDHALPITRALGLPVTIFAVTQASRNRDGFWWDALARSGVLTADRREYCLTVLAGDGEKILASEPSVTGASHAALKAADWPSLRAAAGDLVAIQMHTQRHRCLPVLTQADLEAEFDRAPFESEMGAPPSIISYPYGRFSPHVTAESARLGYAAGLGMEFGVARPGCDLFALPRLNVPAGISIDALECRAAGLLPRAS